MKAHIWEVWLREEQFETFKAKAHELGDITVSAHHLKFPERQICSVRRSLESLEKIELMKSHYWFSFSVDAGRIFRRPSAEGTKRLEQGTIFTAHLQSGC